MIKKIVLISVILLVTVLINAQTKNRTMISDQEKEQVLQIHKKIFNAIAEKIEPDLRENMQDVFLFTSANADVQDKETFIKGFAMNPAIKLPLFVSSNENVIVKDNTAILTARVHINIIKGNEPVRDVWERITGTYIKQGNEWKLMALQATYMKSETP